MSYDLKAMLGILNLFFLLLGVIDPITYFSGLEPNIDTVGWWRRSPCETHAATTGGLCPTERRFTATEARSVFVGVVDA